MSEPMDMEALAEAADMERKRLREEAMFQPATLTGYITAVSDYWTRTTTDQFCKRCEFYDGPGYCGMLHDASIPDGDCFALKRINGWKQPEPKPHDD